MCQCYVNRHMREAHTAWFQDQVTRQCVLMYGRDLIQLANKERRAGSRRNEEQQPQYNRASTAWFCAADNTSFLFRLTTGPSQALRDTDRYPTGGGSAALSLVCHSNDEAKHNGSMLPATAFSPSARSVAPLTEHRKAGSARSDAMRTPSPPHVSNGN